MTDTSAAPRGAAAGSSTFTVAPPGHFGTASRPLLTGAPATSSSHSARSHAMSRNDCLLRMTRRAFAPLPVNVTATGRWHHASSRIAGCGAMSEWTRPSATKLPSFGVSPNWPPYAKRFVPSASTCEMPWSFHSHTKPPCRPGVFSKACQ